MESVRLHHVIGLLQLPTCRHLHHQQCRRQEIHRHIHRGQRTQRLLAAHGRSRIQRDIRQQRKLRLVLLQQRHHVGHLPLTHLRRSHLHGNRHHANGSHRQTDRQNRRGRHQPAKSRRCARLRGQTRHSHRRRPIQRRRSGPGLSRKAQRIRLVLTRIKRRLPVNRRPRQLPHRPTARRNGHGRRQ